MESRTAWRAMSFGLFPEKHQISPWSCRTDCSALFLSPSVDGTISPQYYSSLPVWGNTGTTVEMGLNGWKPVSGWPSSGPDSPPPNTLHHCKEGIMHFWTGQMHATPTLQESQWPCKAQSNGKARFWVISDHRDLQLISHCMGHHPMWSYIGFVSNWSCIHIVLVMGLKGSDKATTPLSRTNTWHILWLQLLLLPRIMHEPELVSVLQANYLHPGQGGQGAGMRPPSDTVNTGGGAVKMQSCWGGTCKSQALSERQEVCFRIH